MNLKQKNINFYTVYRSKRQPEAQKGQGVLRALAVPIALVAVVVGLFGFFTLQANSLQGKLKPVIAYLDDANTTSKVEEANQLLQKLNSAIAARDALQKGADALASYPLLSTQEVRTIESVTQGVHITALGFDRTSGKVTITATCAGATDAAAYVARLRRTGAFAGLSYQGYDSDLDGQYHFDVSITLKGGN